MGEDGDGGALSSSDREPAQPSARQWARTLDWIRHQNEAPSPFLPRSHSGQPRNLREGWYAISIPETCKQGLLAIEFFVRERRQDGSTGVRNNELSKVIVYSFSRFARSTTHLLTALEEMKQHDTEFTSLTERIETNSPMGRAFFTVIAAIAQLERELIVERVKNGLKNARAKGIRIGRKKTRPSELIRALRRSGMSYSGIAKVTNCSEGAIGAELKEWAQELAKNSRTILDEIVAHTAEKTAKTSQPIIEVSGPGIAIEQGTAVELEIVR